MNYDIFVVGNVGDELLLFLIVISMEIVVDVGNV